MKIEVGEFERIYPCLNENTLSEYSGRGNLHIIGVSRGWPIGQLPTIPKFIAHEFFWDDEFYFSNIEFYNGNKFSKIIA